MDNKCPRRKKNRKRSVQGCTRRKLEMDDKEEIQRNGERKEDDLKSSNRKHSQFSRKNYYKIIYTRIHPGEIIKV